MHLLRLGSLLQEDLNLRLLGDFWYLGRLGGVIPEAMSLQDWEHHSQTPETLMEAKLLPQQLCGDTYSWNM